MYVNTPRRLQESYISAVCVLKNCFTQRITALVASEI